MYICQLNVVDEDEVEITGLRICNMWEGALREVKKTLKAEKYEEVEPDEVEEWEPEGWDDVNEVALPRHVVS